MISIVHATFVNVFFNFLGRDFMHDLTMLSRYVLLRFCPCAILSYPASTLLKLKVEYDLQTLEKIAFDLNA